PSSSKEGFYEDGWIAGSSPAMTRTGFVTSIVRSLRGDAGSFDDRPPFLDLGLVVRVERRRRELFARRHFQTEIGDAPAHYWIGERVHHRRVEPGNDVVRRVLRRPEGMPQSDMKAGHSRFVDRRDLRRGDPAGLGENGIGFDLTAGQMRQRRRRLGRPDIDLPGHQIVYRGAAAAIRDELESGPGFLFEIDQADVPGAAETDDGGGSLDRIGFEPRNQLSDIIGGEVFPRRYQQRCNWQQGYRFE